MAEQVDYMSSCKELEDTSCLLILCCWGLHVLLMLVPAFTLFCPDLVKLLRSCVRAVVLQHVLFSRNYSYYGWGSSFGSCWTYTFEAAIQLAA